MKTMVMVVMVAVMTVSAFAEDNIKLRQTLGGDQIFFWYHNGNRWSAEMLMDAPNSWVMVGAGPRYSTVIGTTMKINIINYFALVNDVSKKQWPIKVFESENLITVKFGKWVIHMRTVVDMPKKEGSIVFVGRDFLIYQFSQSWQIGPQTEWKYQKKFDQSIGLGWRKSLSATLSLDGYFGVKTKEPHAKVGWFRLNATFK